MAPCTRMSSSHERHDERKWRNWSLCGLCKLKGYELTPKRHTNSSRPKPPKLGFSIRYFLELSPDHLFRAFKYLVPYARQVQTVYNVHRLIKLTFDIICNELSVGWIGFFSAQLSFKSFPTSHHCHGRRRHCYLRLLAYLNTLTMAVNGIYL
jgi:hypothetical protein